MSDAGIEIEQASIPTPKKKFIPTNKEVEKHPDYPKEWIDKDLPTLISQGWKYYKHTRKDTDRTYMSIRHGRNERGLGVFSEEKEGKLFHFFPNIQTTGTELDPNAPRATWAPSLEPKMPSHSYLGVPIARAAVIPREYVPSLNVLKYFKWLKDNGFPYDFSTFINDVVDKHFHDCKGVEISMIIMREDVEFEGEKNLNE